MALPGPQSKQPAREVGQTAGPLGGDRTTQRRPFTSGPPPPPSPPPPPAAPLVIMPSRGIIYIEELFKRDVDRTREREGSQSAPEKRQQRAEQTARRKEARQRRTDAAAARATTEPARGARRKLRLTEGKAINHGLHSLLIYSLPLSPPPSGFQDEEGRQRKARGEKGVSESMVRITQDSPPGGRGREKRGPRGREGPSVARAENNAMRRSYSSHFS